MHPFFTIVIPTLNEEKFLPRLLTSISDQHRDDVEVIVVDADSHDQTVAVARSFASTLRHSKVISIKIRNASVQRNIGAKNGHGEWLIFVDADTVLCPSFFCDIQSYAARTGATFLTTWLRSDEHGITNILLTLFMNINYEFLLLIGRPMSPGPLTVIKRDVFYRIGQYDESRQYGEDYDLSLRGVKQHVRFYIVPRILHVMSFRRLRKKGYLKTTLLYIWTTFSGAITGRVIRSVHGYKTGGHVYR